MTFNKNKGDAPVPGEREMLCFLRLAERFLAIPGEKGVSEKMGFLNPCGTILF